MRNQKEAAHPFTNVQLNTTQKNSSKDTESSDGVNTPSECQIKTPLQMLPGWQAEADRIAGAYTRTLAQRHLRAWRMHCGGVMAQLRAYGRHLTDALHSLKGGAA